MAPRSSVSTGTFTHSALLVAAVLTMGMVSCRVPDTASTGRASSPRGAESEPDRPGDSQRAPQPAGHEPVESAPPRGAGRPVAAAEESGAAGAVGITDQELDDLLGSFEPEFEETEPKPEPRPETEPETESETEPETGFAASRNRPGENMQTAIPGPAATARRGDDMTRRDYGSDCLSSGCHGSLGEFPAVHGPVAALACDACHIAGDDAALHEFRPARSNETMCTFCHTVTQVGKVVHKPFAESLCLDCHDPHGGATRESLRAGTSGLTCVKCHEPFKDEVLHEPVRNGECSLCHVSHQSDEPHLLVRSSKGLCGSSGCHEKVDALIAASPYVHGPVAVDCGSCHLAHGGGHPFMLREPPFVLCLGCHDSVATKMDKDAHVHGPLETENGCSECHTPHASQWLMQLRGAPGELCLDCHNREIYSPKTERKIANVALEIRSSEFKHGPVATGDCQGCHFSHSSAHPGLLVEHYAPEFYQEFSESDYVLCFSCHERDLALLERTTTATKFRDGDRNLHYLHVNQKKGRTCAVCHEMHASNHPSLLRESVPFGSVGWQLPIGHTRTPTGGMCAPGCHRAVPYDNGGAVESVDARSE